MAIHLSLSCRMNNVQRDLPTFSKMIKCQSSKVTRLKHDLYSLDSLTMRCFIKTTNGFNISIDVF